VNILNTTDYTLKNTKDGNFHVVCILPTVCFFKPDFWALPSKLWTQCKNGKADFKIHMKLQETPKGKIIVKKNKAGELTPPNFKITVVKII
jgi:hypothetical protein